MKKLMLIGMFIVLFSSMACGADCVRITATGNAEYPPILWRDKAEPQKLVGVSIELLQQAFGDLGITVEGKYVGNWARAQSTARDGSVDMLAGAFITEERKTYMDYVTPPFMMTPSVIFVMKGQAFPFSSWEDLVGLKGGTLINNSFGEKFDRFAAEKLSIEGVASIEQAFRKMAAGRNRYVVYERYQGLAISEVTGFRDKIEYLPNSVINEGLYFTFSKKSTCNTPDLRAHLARKVRKFTEQKLPDVLVGKYLKIWKAQHSPSASR
ncbi:amino acid ABC transporter substrate-binding pro tein [Desulfonema ishimotonii]|uniref:Amino acid ABC transporter substrate-binding pro tein n=1 Tax=Desulfonema ishimotonii TaxID=45657 RepID=A0A401FR00_9BACT|nr:transporter substrate-binding domain-containing protein [Desulfonema ishimotonii]GBC59392.1 amino acid ABC transporter substrate-binding pro tein [Desulfonema ishimotonii]